MSNRLMLYLTIAMLFSPILVQASNPIWPVDNWQKADMAAQGLNPDLVDDFVSYLKEESDFNPEAILIVKNGFMVKEYYASDFDETDTHTFYEVSKSIISTIVGVAIQQGVIDSVDQKIFHLLPNLNLTNIDPRKTDITIKQILTMTSGYIDQVHLNPDNWVADFINEDLTFDPGTTFAYGCQALSLIPVMIETQTGQSFEDYAQLNLFDPLNIDSDKVKWTESGADMCDVDASFSMTPQDLAKIGHLMLNDGVWDNQRILPQGWSNDAQTQYIKGTYQCSEAIRGYGYTWWLSKEDAPSTYYYAEGKFGQKLYIVPEYDITVVLSGAAVTNIYQITTQQNFAIDKYLIPAAQTDGNKLAAPGMLLVITALLVVMLPLRRMKNSK